jgi:hypothetical protein
MHRGKHTCLIGDAWRLAIKLDGAQVNCDSWCI